jgi:site-specific recombinase XerD
MKVTIREKSINNGNEKSLYLDIYRAKNERYKESLKLKVFTKPKSIQERTHNTNTKSLAEQIRAKKMLELQEGFYGIKITKSKYGNFVQYFKMLTDKREMSGLNFNHWDSTYKQLIKFTDKEKCKPTFAQINKEWLEDFKMFLLKNLSQNSAASYFNILRHAIHEAKRDKLIFDDPLHNVHTPKTIESQRDYLTLEELEKLAVTDCKDELYKRVFLFGCLTGLRISDMIKLKWSEIKHSNEMGYHIVYTQKKTKNNEVLQINEQARAFLGDEKLSDEVVFQGLTYSDRNNRMLKHWALDAGVRKNVTFHIARHTFATLQLTHGTDIYVLSKLLGHKKVSTTQIYGKIIDDTKRKAVDNLPVLNISFNV